MLKREKKSNFDAVKWLRPCVMQHRFVLCANRQFFSISVQFFRIEFWEKWFCLSTKVPSRDVSVDESK